METTESPLDVLSRAATMVQDCTPPEYDCARPCGGNKELPSVRWRRDRREKHSGGYTKHRTVAAPPPEQRAVDAPLDMTTPRGLPPPYSQCVGSRGLKYSARPSVITCAPRPRREQLSDPVIDEHFRRSLGNDYMSLFAGSEEKTPNGSSVTVTGLSVDDHFAKALGDTWVRLQKSDSDSSTKGEDSPPPAPVASPAAQDKTPATTAKPPATTSSLLQQRRGLLTI